MSHLPWTRIHLTNPTTHVLGLTDSRVPVPKVSLFTPPPKSTQPFRALQEPTGRAVEGWVRNIPVPLLQKPVSAFAKYPLAFILP